MALPLLLIPAVKLWASRALMGAGLAWLTTESGLLTLWEDIKKAIVKEALERGGLELNPDDPFSDASLSNALSLRTGVTIRTLKDKDSIREDIETYALDLMQQKTGYTITTLRDVERMKYDFMVIGLAIVQQKTGIPLTPPAYGEPWADVIKANVEDWARAKVQTEMAAQVGTALAAIEAHGDLEGIVGRMNTRLADIGSIQTLNVRQLAMEVAEGLASSAVDRFQLAASGVKTRSRRSEQLRAAQRRFRERWGNRSTYNPVI